MRYNPYKSMTSFNSKRPTYHKKYFKTQFLINKRPVTREQLAKRLPKIGNKELLYGDFDGDGVINKYDCKPFNKKKQGTDEEELKRFNITSKELVEIQRKIYNLSENWRKLPENSQDRKIAEDEIKTLKEKARGLLQTAINLKTNIDNKKDSPTPKMESILNQFKKDYKRNKWIDIYNRYIDKLLKQGYDIKYAQAEAKIMTENDLRQEHKPVEIRLKNWSGKTLRGLRLKPFG